MRSTAFAFLASALLLVGVGCGDDGSEQAGDPAPGTEATATTTTSTTVTTVTTTTTSAPTTTTTAVGGELVRCASSEGYSIEYPADWHTNSGEVVPACGHFSPDPFEVPRGTDERVAPITAYIDPVAFEDVSAPRGVEDLERASTTIDGLPAVRRSYESSGSGLWPDGTPITAYVIDLSPGADEPRRTMFVNAVGTPPFAPDHARNVAVLDRMAPTIRFSSGGTP
jgi:hypothetical protein